MYRSCIFCSADLGANQAIEEFPVGRSLAFDAWKGRLWAVCPKCGRWNLAPIEERWEAVEAAEKRFRDSRLRVQSENVGLCKLPDGTKLVRVGQALPGELAAWRYGDTLVGRRRKYLLYTGVGVAGALVLTGGLWAAGAVGAANVFFQVGRLAWERRQGEKVVGRVPGEQSSTGAPFELRRHQLGGAVLRQDPAGEVALYLPEGLSAGGWKARGHSVPLTLYGDTARSVLARGMTIANAKGARSNQVADALAHLESAGSADELVRRLSGRGSPLGIRRVAGRGGAAARGRARSWGAADPGKLTVAESLALEMALHERQERLALEGELSGLEAAWREAEEIAGIADSLPDDPIDRLGR
jgi:hypothetical protein